MNRNTTSRDELSQEAEARSTSGQPHDLQPGQDLADYIKAYARQKPEVAALWCFGVGFIVGWKLKPW